MASINWAQLAKDAGNVQPPQIPGPHLVTIVKAVPKVAQTGNHYWQCTMQIQSGPDAGKTVRNNFTLSQDNPKAVEYFFKTMLALGISQDMLIATNGDDQAVANMLVGKQAQITLKESTNPQYPDPDVEYVNAHPNGPVAQQGAVGAPTGFGAAPVSIPQAQAAPMPQASPQAPPSVPQAPAIPQQATELPTPAAPAPAAPPMPAAPQAMPAQPQPVPAAPAMPQQPAMVFDQTAQMQQVPQAPVAQPEQPQAPAAAPALPVPPTPSF